MGTLIINLTFNRKGNITIVYIRLLTHFELYYIYFFSSKNYKRNIVHSHSYKYKDDEYTQYYFSVWRKWNRRCTSFRIVCMFPSFFRKLFHPTCIYVLHTSHLELESLYETISNYIYQSYLSILSYCPVVRYRGK